MNVKKEPKVFIVETGEEIVRISEDVLATVAGLAAAEVEGVAGLNGNVAESLLSLMGRKNPAAGVRVCEGEKGLVLEVNLTLAYGHSAPRVACRVQKAVLSAVEDMTGIAPVAVNVAITDVAMPKAEA
ncbi:MAG: Asp23/Gls24 family envelope stress response protein [Clostridia bacterium]|nr:Asp23/Gls24 family envelope stress response protein [Clostridia bacterium]